jgi:Arc-like DNA binding dprotein
VRRKLDDTVQLKLRFSESLRRRLERAAKAKDRSLNSEMVSRLEQSFLMDELDAQMKAAVGKSFKDALMVPIWEIGRFTRQERMVRFFKELAGLDPDKSEEAPAQAQRGGDNDKAA